MIHIYTYTYTYTDIYTYADMYIHADSQTYIHTYIALHCIANVFLSIGFAYMIEVTPNRCCSFIDASSCAQDVSGLAKETWIDREVDLLDIHI